MGDSKSIKSLSIEDADFEHVVAIYAEMQKTAQAGSIKTEATNERFFSVMDEYRELLDKIVKYGGHPIASIGYRVLQTSPVTQDTIDFMWWLRSRLPIGFEKNMSDLDRRVFNAFLRAFAFGFWDGIEVSHWPVLAGTCRAWPKNGSGRRGSRER